MEIKFTNYEIIPSGSNSLIRVQRSNNKIEELPLYGCGGWRPFGQPLLDQAIVAYMDCFCQLEAQLKTHFQPVNFCLFFFLMFVIVFRVYKYFHIV